MITRGKPSDWNKFYKDIGESIRKKSNGSVIYRKGDILIGQRPKEDKKLLIEVNFKRKRIINKKIDYSSWIEFWEYEGSTRSGSSPVKYYHHKIHTTFMTIDEMTDFLLELYEKIKEVNYEETIKIIDEYEDNFNNLREIEESLTLKNEKELEDYLVEACDYIGWKCEKLSPKIFGKGIPDRKITKDDGSVVFVELKTPKKKGKLSFDQYSRHEDLRDQGYEVKVMWSKEQINRLIESVT